jgi:hypothetical protein
MSGHSFDVGGTWRGRQAAAIQAAWLGHVAEASELACLRASRAELTERVSDRAAARAPIAVEAEMGAAMLRHPVLPEMMHDRMSNARSRALHF